MVCSAAYRVLAVFCVCRRGFGAIDCQSRIFVVCCVWIVARDVSRGSVGVEKAMDDESILGSIVDV